MSFTAYLEAIASSNVNVFVVFPGRFQPFTKGHLDGVVKALDIAGPYLNKMIVLTSDIKGEKSFLSFEERKYLIEEGVKHDARVVVRQLKEGTPYNYKSILNSIPEIDSSKHHLILLVTSSDDANRVKNAFPINSTEDIENLAGKAGFEKRVGMVKSKIGDKFNSKTFVFSAMGKIVMPRAKQGGTKVSGTRVREAIQENNWDVVKELVPYDLTEHVKKILKKLVNVENAVTPPEMKADKGLHLEHLEKAIARPSRREAAVDILQKLINGNKNLTVTQKIDGRPVIIFGRDMDNEFFIGMKDDVLKGKYMKSYDDIEKMHTFDAEKAGEKAEMIKGKLGGKIKMFNSLFEILSGMKIPAGVAYGADVLFYPGFGNKQMKNNMYAVKPNTTWYIATNKEISERIKAAQIGLAVHTKFKMDGGVSNPTAVTTATSGLTPIPQVFIPRTQFVLEPLRGVESDLAKFKRTGDIEAIKKIRNKLLDKYQQLDLRAEVTTSDTGDEIASDKGEGLVVHDNTNGNTFKVVDIEGFTKHAREIHATRKREMWK